jgi:hypothetical protein
MCIGIYYLKKNVDADRLTQLNLENLHDFHIHTGWHKISTLVFIFIVVEYFKINSITSYRK